MPLTTEIVQLLESDPDRRWTIWKLREHFAGRVTRLDHLYAALGKLANEKWIWRIKRGLYQANGRKKVELESLNSDCERVLSLAVMRRYASGRRKPIRCCRACHNGNGENPPGFVTERGLGGLVLAWCSA